ncbi:4401_t:CDS:2, partial [Entrophospora sp. SA101]
DRILSQSPTGYQQFFQTSSLQRYSENKSKLDNNLNSGKIIQKIKEIPKRENIWNVPNVFTLSRLAASPIIGYFILNQQYELALGLFFYAGISDLKVSLQANRDGDLENMEVKGDLELIVSDANTSKIKISVRATDSDNLQLKTHPNVDKKLFSTENIIALKNPGKGFPVNHPLPVLRWRFINKDEALIPLSISCWSSAAGDGTIDVNIEYELKDENRELTDVVTSIPLPSGGNPTIGEVDGDYELNRQLKSLEWKLPIINSSNKQGTFEFNIPGDDLNAFFPMSVTFISEKLICDIEVLDVINSENESTVTFSEEKLLTVEEYVIV